MYHQLPRGEFTLSELPDDLGVSSTVNNSQGAHMAMALALKMVDENLSPGQEKGDIMEGMVQAWEFFARERGEDAHVEHTADLNWRLQTDVVEHCSDRPGPARARR